MRKLATFSLLVSCVLFSFALPSASFAQASSAASEPVGDPAVGEAIWGNGPRARFESKMCANCHGSQAEGGFGPDLAGARGLTFDQFRQAIRHPWGVMVAYSEQQLPDQKIADVYAYLKTKPKVTTRGQWHWMPAPARAALGQHLHMETIGCGQCHEPENRYVRGLLGANAKDVTFDYFAKLVYEHTSKYPSGRMGNYSRQRLPELVLREVYKWLVDDLGMRASMAGAMTVGNRNGDSTTYSVTVTNMGVKDKGLKAEGLTVFVKVPPGTTVSKGEGAGYSGVTSFASLGFEPALELAPHPHDASAHVEWPEVDRAFDVAVWKVPQLAPGEKFSASLTLTGPLTPEVLQGFSGSAVRWTTPGRRAAGKPPLMVYRDLRSPDSGDHERIAVPSMPSAAGSQ
jgi:mono/diheme cytochrome c family protein